MTRFEPNLRIPGPTALPPTVREAGGRQMVNHRGEEFKALLGRVEALVRELLAAALGVRPADVQIVRGHGQARKIVQIGGLGQEQLEQWLATIVTG